MQAALETHQGPKEETGGFADDDSRDTRAGEGGENRQGTGVVGARLPTGGQVVNNPPYSGRGNSYFIGAIGLMTDISNSALTAAQIVARRGTGGGGAGGYQHIFNSGVFGWGRGTGGGGGGGSSAIKRGNTVLLEGYGGRGAGGQKAPSGFNNPVDGFKGEAGLDNSSVLTVTPGEVLTVVVGQGGRGSKGFTNGANGQDGRINIVSVQDEDSSGKATHTSVVTAELCGSKQHARKISQETAIRSQLHRVSGRLTRKFLGVEPGDILKFKTSPTELSVLITDRGINSDLTVDVVGLRLPTTASEGVQPLSGNISGPSNLIAGARADYTSEFTGGTGNVTYQWQRRSGTSGAWSNVGTNHTYSTTRSSAGTYQVRCTISRGSESVTTRTLTTIWGSRDSECICSASEYQCSGSRRRRNNSKVGGLR